MKKIVADTHKYVMLSCNQKSIYLKKGEVMEIDDINADFLVKKYDDIKLYEAKDNVEKSTKKVVVDEISKDNK